MKILVTGKSGLIGSNLLDRLLKDGYDAIGTSTKDGDLRDSDYCLEVTKGVDVVFHCAANTSGAHVMQNSPLSHVTPNVIMNANLMEACYVNKVKKFIFMSSSVVYSYTAEKPNKEDEFTFGDGGTALQRIGTGSFIAYAGGITDINIGRGSNTVTTFGGHIVPINITASGDISASGDVTSVTGSFSRLDTSVMNASDYFLNNTQIFDVTGTGTEITLNVSTQATPNTELKGGAILINSDPSGFGSGDIELRAKGRNIKFTTGSSTKFDFNLGSSPSLIASGSVFNIISDNDEFNFADGNFQRVNNITSSGHISASGTGDHKFGGDIITAGNITASNGLLFTNETIATITANESLTLNLERTNDLNTTYFKIHNLYRSNSFLIYK